MNYPLWKIYEGQFEDLVIQICQKILGIGVQQFSKGPDGGRDAEFNGTAENFPSTIKPDTGNFIVQAKHSNNPTAKFSDNDFWINKSSVLAKEISRIKKLKEAGEIDVYILFSNRRLGATANKNITTWLKKETGVPKIYLRGTEFIEDILKKNPDIPNHSGLNPFITPLQIFPDDLAEIITAFHHSKDIISQEFENKYNLSTIELKKKNKINGLSKKYFSIMEKEYMKYFDEIDSFLKNPINKPHQDFYLETTNNLNLKIIAYKPDHPTFDKILEAIFDNLILNDPDLKRHKELTKTFLFYMYCQCDIGEKNHAKTN